MPPSLFRRISATLIDLGVIFGVVSFVIQQPIIAGSEAANLWAALAFVLLYEPVLTTYACTLGQAVMRTRVRHFETLQRVSLAKSYLRFFMKYVASFAGGASARGTVRVWPRQDLRAIHDQTADTVVVNVSDTER
jgi:uncharacterized RDD family membrane protein YckC